MISQKGEIMSNQENHNEEMNSIISLTDEQGNEVQFELLDVVPYGGKEYIAIIPVSEEEDDQMVQLYRIVPDESGETETYVGLESEEELEAVYHEFQNRNADLFDFED